MYDDNIVIPTWYGSNLLESNSLFKLELLRFPFTVVELLDVFFEASLNLWLSCNPFEISKDLLLNLVIIS